MLIVTAGTDVYPDPGLVIVIEVTIPAALIDAIPVAVVPLVGGATVIGGAEIYFPPVFVILNDVIVPPALTVTVAAAPTVVGLNTTFGISPYSSPPSVIVTALNPSFTRIAVAIPPEPNTLTLLIVTVGASAVSYTHLRAHET